MLLASDDNNRDFAGARNPDDVLHVQFFVKATPNNFMSKKEGRPIFQDENFIKIMVPGRSDLTVERPIEPGDENRFPRQWMMFRNATAESEQLVGTPVAEWPILTRSQAEELRAKKFYTVEQVASCSDDQITALGMNANNLRIKARAFLSVAKDSAVAQAQAEQLKERDDRIAALEAKLDQVLAGGGKPAKKAKTRKPMSDEARAAAGARLKAAREAKRAAQQQEPAA